MSKDYTAEELASKTFYITMAGIGLFIAAVFVFVLW
jgi:hypothetical protein